MIPTVEQVLAEDKIIPLIPDEGKGGLTGEVHTALCQGEKYILRRCKSSRNAEMFARHSQQLIGVAPRLLGKSGNDLLYEFLEGRDCTKKDADTVAYDVGRIAGITSQIPYEGSYNPEERFYVALNDIESSRVIDSTTRAKIVERYQRFGPDEIRTGVELGDLTSHNFRLSDGKVYLVDIDGVYPTLKGMCFAKAFLVWFKEQQQREKFVEGYDSIVDNSILTPHYKQFIYLNWLVKKLKETPTQKRRNMLALTLEGNLE